MKQVSKIFLGLLLCSMVGSSFAARSRMPLDLSGKTIVLTSRANAKNPGYKPMTYYVYFHGANFNVKHHTRQSRIHHFGHYIYTIISHQYRVAVIQFEDSGSYQKVGKKYRYMMFFEPDGHHGEFIYERLIDHQNVRINAGSFNIVSGK